MLEKIKKLSVARFYIMLIIVGIIFAAISGFVLMQPKGDIVKAEAKIVSIRETGSTSEGKEYEVLVDYKDYKGIIHRNMVYTAYSSSMKIGDVVIVEYDRSNPELINPEGSGFILILFLAIGLACIVFGILGSVKAIKTPASSYNQLDKTAHYEFSEEEQEAALNTDEELREYYFHFCGKMNQSYILETPSRKAIYEANCEKIELIKDTNYEFKNNLTGTVNNYKISHTLTKRYGRDYGNVEFSIPESSVFKIDGVECWEYIASKGYSMKMDLQGISLNFDIYRFGEKVARLDAAGANLLRDDKQYKLDIPSPGIYKVSCRESDIAMVFMCAFAASRVEFF